MAASCGILFILLSALVFLQIDSVTVHNFDGTQKESSLVHSSYSPGRPFTFCAWFKINEFKAPSVLMSLSEGENDWKISIAVTPSQILIQTPGGIETFSSKTVPDSWNHCCIKLSRTEVHIVMNNQSSNAIVFQEVLAFLNNRLYIGGGTPWHEVRPTTIQIPKEDIRKSLQNFSQPSFNGLISEPQVYETLLFIDAINALASCKNISEKPSILEWSQGTQSTSDVSYDNICSRSQEFVFFNKRLTNNENSKTCEEMGLTLIKSLSSELSPFPQEIQSGMSFCQRESKIWVKSNLEEEGCMAISDGSRKRVSCNSKLCSGCTLDRNIYYTMRGLCTSEDVDLTFTLASNEDGTQNFKGIDTYDIIRSGTAWVLINKSDKLRIASSPSSAYPMGLKEWFIESSICNFDNNTKAMISLDSCMEDEFGCKSGQCIRMGNRCDHIVDCNDGSDEDGCAKVVLPHSYQEELPPGVPQLVDIDIDVFRVLSIPPKSPLSLRMQLSFTWRDDRVQFSNFQPGVETSIPYSGMWAPHLLPLSIDTPLSLKTAHGSRGGVFSVPKTTDGSYLYAVTKSEPFQTDRSMPQKELTFPGSNTTLNLVEFVDQVVDCDFGFSFFPFDEHVCSLSLVMYPWPSSIARINSSSLRSRYSGPPRLVDYTLHSTSFNVISKQIGPDTHNGVALNFYFVRRPALYVMSIYLPSFFLLIVGNASLWISVTPGHPSYIRLFLNCFCFVGFLILWGLSTILSPAHRHLTAIDVWLCFGTSHSILLVTVFVLLDVFQTDEEDDTFSRIGSRFTSARVREVKSLDNTSLYGSFIAKIKLDDSLHHWSLSYWIQLISKVVSPSLCLLFFVGYWPIVLYFTRRDFQ